MIIIKLAKELLAPGGLDQHALERAVRPHGPAVDSGDLYAQASSHERMEDDWCETLFPAVVSVSAISGDKTDRLRGRHHHAIPAASPRAIVGGGQAAQHGGNRRTPGSTNLKPTDAGGEKSTC
jgi:hypothetical protein